MSRATRLAAAGVFAFCLLVYGATLYPTVPGGDAGELVAVADALGVVHPPGYPLWTLAAKLFTVLPGGSTAWRVAWMSAAATAAAAALVFAVVVMFLVRRGGEFSNPSGGASGNMAAGLAAAALFAFSPTPWAYAVGAEVFALHGFLVALLVFLALRWDDTRRLRDARAVAFTMGLGLAHHHTMIFYALPVAAWLLWRGRASLLAPASLARLVAAGLLGLTPYLYLFVAGAMENPLSWGDTASAGGFLDHLLRRDYGTFQLLPPGHAESSSWLAKIGAWAGHFSSASLGVGLVLAFVAAGDAAAVTLSPRKGAGQASAWVLLLAASAAFYLAAFHALANVAVGDAFLLAVLSRFWIQADLVLCILAGIGLGIACGRLGRHGAAVGWTLAVVLVVMRLGLSGGERADRGGGVVEDYGRAILEPLPEGALLLTQGDLVTNVVRYLQSCEGFRRDVIVLDQELLTRPWYVRRMARLHAGVRFPGGFYHPGVAGGFTMREFLGANHEGHRIFVYPEWKSGDPGTEAAWKTWPEGLASRVLPVSSLPDVAEWNLQSSAALSRLDARGWPALGRYAVGTWERVALEDLWQARHRRAVFVLKEALARGDDAGLLQVARGEFEAAARSHPEPPYYLFKNLGIVHERLAAASPWLRREQLAAWKRYLEIAPASDADRPAVAAAVERLEAAGAASSLPSGR